MPRPARITSWLASISCSQISSSLRAQRSNPDCLVGCISGLLRCARNDGVLRLQDNSVARRAGDGSVGLLGALERIHGVRLDGEWLQMPGGKTRAELAKHRACRDRRQAECVDADIGVLSPVELEDVELHERV